MARGEIRLMFLPVFSLADLALTGFEALPCWQHQTEGLIGPERFMALAEAAGLMQELGSQLLERACAEAVAAGGVRMAVSLGAGQFRDADLPARLQAVLRQTGLKPACLELEVTEAMLALQPQGGTAMLAALQELGVGIVLDDFGLSEASLSALGSLPLTRLKIGRRFVQKLGRDTEAGAMVKAILTLGANLRLEVIAAGVESLTQLEYLRQHGCSAAQGRLLGEPGARAVARPPAIALPPLHPALASAPE